MQDRENDDHIALYREVHGVWEAPQQDASDSGPQVLVREWVAKYSVVRGPKFFEELAAEADRFIFVPIERRRDIEVSSRLGEQPILGHSYLFARRSRTSWAGRARLGSRR